MMRNGLWGPSIAPDLGEPFTIELQGASHLGDSRVSGSDHKADTPSTRRRVRLCHQMLHAPSGCRDLGFDGSVRREFAKTSTDKIDDKAACVLVGTCPYPG